MSADLALGAEPVEDLLLVGVRADVEERGVNGRGHAGARPALAPNRLDEAVVLRLVVALELVRLPV